MLLVYYYDSRLEENNCAKVPLLQKCRPIKKEIPIQCSLRTRPEDCSVY